MSIESIDVSVLLPCVELLTLKSLFLNSPSYERFDSGGTRYQATRKTKSLWYPVFLASASALVKESRVIDSAAEGYTRKDIPRITKGYGLVFINTVPATLLNDISVAEEIKTTHDSKVALVGPSIGVIAKLPFQASNMIDYVCRGEYDFTSKELAEEKDLSSILGLSWRKNGETIHNPNRPLIENLDLLPFVSPIYKRDLTISNYRLPQHRYPYISIWTSRGCPARCIYCLFPQTFLGHRFRVRSPQNVFAELDYVKEELPQLREIVFDDDTFTVDRKRVIEICNTIKPLNLVWSCNARANVPSNVLKEMKQAGCRLLIVGYESGNEQILRNVKKGVSKKQMMKFTKDCKKLDLMIHGCFIFGLPGETKTTIKETIEFSKDLDLESIQGAVASPYPGTEFYDYCREKGFLRYEYTDFDGYSKMADQEGYQSSIIEFPDLTAKEIVEAVDTLHAKYYYRPKYFLNLFKLMFKGWGECERIISSGWEFNRYMMKRLRSRIHT